MCNCIFSFLCDISTDLWKQEEFSDFLTGLPLVTTPLENLVISTAQQIQKQVKVFVLCLVTTCLLCRVWLLHLHFLSSDTVKNLITRGNGHHLHFLTQTFAKALTGYNTASWIHILLLICFCYSYTTNYFNKEKKHTASFLGYNVVKAVIMLPWYPNIAVVAFVLLYI